MGKTSLALDIARHVAADQKKNVAFFSLEMMKHELMDRLIAGSLGVETWKLKQGRITDDEFQQLGAGFSIALPSSQSPSTTIPIHGWPISAAKPAAIN